MCGEGDIRCEIYYISDRASGRILSLSHSLSLTVTGWLADSISLSFSHSLFNVVVQQQYASVYVCVCVVMQAIVLFPFSRPRPRN